LAGDSFDQIGKDIANNNRIEHQQEIVARHGGPSGDLPTGLVGLEDSMRGDNGLSARPAYRKFRNKARDAQYEQEECEEDYVRASAISTYPKGQQPDISKPYGAGYGNHEES
jgi:hypothetical protein